MSKFYLFLIFIITSNNLLFSETKYKINNLGLDQNHSHAYSINNEGEIHGTFTASNSEGRYKSIFYWSPETGLTELSSWNFFPSYKLNSDISINSYISDLLERYKDKGKKKHSKRVEVLGNAINNVDEIAGTATVYGVPSAPDGYVDHAFLFRDSEIIEIGKNYSSVDINDNSQVLLVETGKIFTRSLMWDNGNLITLWQGGWPKAINNHASVVGFYANGAAAIWEDGKVSLLYDLLENPEGWEKLCIAEDINDQGEIVGYGIYQGCPTAFLLTPCE